MNDNEAGVDVVAQNVTAFLNAMDQVSKSFDTLTQDINEAATKIGAASDKMDKAGDEMGGVATDINKVGDATGKAASDVDKDTTNIDTDLGTVGKAAHDAGDDAKAGLKKIPDAAEDAQQKTSHSGDIIKGVFVGIGMAALNMAADAGRAFVQFAGDSVKLAGDFEAGMNKFKVAAGSSIDAKGVEEFRDLFLDIGKRLPVSTMEVQQAAETLVKGGIDPLVLKLGGLEKSIQFAAAGGMGLDAAAELSVKTLGTFTSATASAKEQTEFLANAQNLLVKVAGASTLDVDTLGKAMLLAGGQAKAAGVDYDDFATTMGLISPSFASAEQAGTSYKNFLVRLIPTTDPARMAMKDLGLVTFNSADAIKTLNANGIDVEGLGVDDMKVALLNLAMANGSSEKEANKWLKAFDQSAFYDLEGNFVGNAKAAELLRNATKDLTDEERVHNLQLIFGNDAMGAAVALADQGQVGFDKFAASVAKASGVNETAAGKQQGFNVAMDNFKGSVEALQITIGTALLPLLTDLFNNVLAPAINTITSLAAAFDSVGVAVSPVQQTFVAMDESLTTAAANFDYVGDVISVVMTMIGTVVEQVLSLVTKFWKENSEMIMTNVAEVWEEVSGIIKDVAEIILLIVTKVFGEITKFLDKNGDDLITFFKNVWKIIFTVIDTALKIIGDVIHLVLSIIKGDWKEAWETVKKLVYDIFSGVITIIQTILNTILNLFGTSLDQLNKDVIRLFNIIVVSIGNEIGKAVTAVENFFIRFMEAGRTLINKIGEGISSVSNLIKDKVSGAVEDAIKFGEGVGSLAAKVLKFGEDLVGSIVSGIINVSDTIGNAIITAVTDALTAAWNAITGFISDPLGNHGFDTKPLFFKGARSGNVSGARNPYVYNPMATGSSNVSTTYQLNLSTQQSEAGIVHQFNVMRAMAR